MGTGLGHASDKPLSRPWPPCRGVRSAMPEIPRIISVDDHVVEPPTLWTDRLPRKYLDIGPRVVRETIRKDLVIHDHEPVWVDSDVERTVDFWLYEDLKRPPHSAERGVGLSQGGSRRPAPSTTRRCAPAAAAKSPPRRHGPQPRRGRHVLPDVPPLLRPDLYGGGR